MSTNLYCKYCGQKYIKISDLTAITCARHPNGQHKGKHALYEGGEKSEYICKFCGQKYKKLSDLTAISCARHPSGQHKGHHEPAI